MTTPPPAGIAEADWQTWPAGARAVILALQEQNLALQEEVLTLRKENEELLARFTLLRIELLITLARIRLAWPDPPAAIQAARQALDLAAAPECGYAWGEADAA